MSESPSTGRGTRIYRAEPLLRNRTVVEVRYITARTDFRHGATKRPQMQPFGLIFGATYIIGHAESF